MAAPAAAMPDEELRAQFFAAFAARPRPDSDDLVAAGPAHPDAHAMAALLAETPREALSAAEVRDVVTNELWALTPPALLHFLPALMGLALQHYSTLSVFVSELVDALTLPVREDVDAAADLASNPTLPPGLHATLQQRRRERFDSGHSPARFDACFAQLAPGEARAVLAFLKALRAAHGADFPFGELDAAIARHWARAAAQG